MLRIFREGFFSIPRSALEIESINPFSFTTRVLNRSGIYEITPRAYPASILLLSYVF